MSRGVYPAGPVIIEIDGFEAVMKLLEADSATIRANPVGSPPTASARLIASGTITMVAPTWLITIENAVVSSASTSSITQIGRPSGRRSMLWPAIHAAAPLLSIAQPRGIRQAIRNTVFQLIAEDRKSTRLNSSHVKISYAVFC